MYVRCAQRLSSRPRAQQSRKLKPRKLILKPSFGESRNLIPPKITRYTVCALSIPAEMHYRHAHKRADTNDE